MRSGKKKKSSTEKEGEYTKKSRPDGHRTGTGRARDGRGTAGDGRTTGGGPDAYDTGFLSL